jgi:hypothetical protein
MQSLDNKTLSRLESAVAKSEYVGQGKKLKVTNKVSHMSLADDFLSYSPGYSRELLITTTR